MIDVILVASALGFLLLLFGLERLGNRLRKASARIEDDEIEEKRFAHVLGSVF